MPTRAGKRCARPGCTNQANPGTGRCTQHDTQDNRARHRTTPTKVARAQPGVAEHRRAAVREHVALHGWRCLGDTDHPAHDTGDLVADDPIPIALGGDPMQQLVVMCRSANSSKGARQQ